MDLIPEENIGTLLDDDVNLLLLFRQQVMFNSSQPHGL